MDLWGIMLIIAIVVLVIGFVFYFVNKWVGRRAAQQQDLVQQHKQTMSIYVIDKKKDKITNANLPKAMTSQLPRTSKLFKMPLVKAKIGAQIMTLVCDNDVFNALPLKKTVSVEMAGVYIVGMKGMKTKLQMANMRKSRRRADETVAPLTFREKIKARFGR